MEWKKTEEDEYVKFTLEIFIENFFIYLHLILEAVSRPERKIIVQTDNTKMWSQDLRRFGGNTIYMHEETMSGY